MSDILFNVGDIVFIVKEKRNIEFCESCHQPILHPMQSAAKEYFVVETKIVSLSANETGVSYFTKTGGWNYSRRCTNVYGDEEDASLECGRLIKKEQKRIGKINDD